MKWLLIIPGCLAALIALAALIGAMLPKGHIAARQAHLRQPADVVFRVISDFVSAPTWRPGVKKVEVLAPRDGKSLYREWGENGALVMQVEESAPPNRLVSRIVDNPAFGGTWTFELTPEGDGCRLAVTERGEVYNPLFRLLGRLFFSPTATMEKYLIALGTKLGEQVTPQAT
jgi:hypothetical protein